ncbi:hypothetical protein BDN70DRAFT_875519 [Pholiota conissans]|uniref:F-box domain-containing protein n=1 Tax=Pholiota conissans TaxID=109636 RepID=A0A9P5Z7H8_9AGAR|nr:hypothetical protein BDN70DRAFT_875519 [Pholiota conissans]
MAIDILSLPNELLVRILARIDPVSLARCLMTCKTLQDIRHNSSQLEYIIQLHLDGLCDAHTSRNYPELLTALLEHRRAWSSLEWSLSSTWNKWVSNYIPVGGLFATTKGKYLNLLHLPTGPAIKAEETTHDFEFRVGEFAVDPTQDLIIFRQNNTSMFTLPGVRLDTMFLHVHALSTNCVHPHARGSPLRHAINGRDTTEIFLNLDVIRNMLIVAFEHTVLVFDWKTSDRILNFDSLSPSLSKGLACTFTFLKPDFYFVTRNHDSGSIWLYALSYSESLTSGENATLLAKLHLPPVSPGTTVQHIQPFTDPIVANALPGMAFMANNDEALHGFSISYTHLPLDAISEKHDTTHVAADLFVPQRVFMRYCVQERPPECAPLEVSWEEWGPSGTRMQMRHPSHKLSGSRYIHGQRAALPDPAFFKDEGSPVAVILDFSLAAVLTASGNNVVPASASSVALPSITHRVMRPTVIPANQMEFFRDDVVTYLPCILTTKRFEKPYWRYMLYEHGIIGLRIDHRDDSLTGDEDQILDIDVYSLT